MREQAWSTGASVDILLGLKDGVSLKFVGPLELLVSILLLLNVLI